MTQRNPSRRGLLLLMAIAALTAFFTCFQLTKSGYGNAYYTAAVKSMLSSWHNFFYASFDNGFMSVDKPALGLWLQCLFALVFGLHGWSVILPEALCAVGSVIVLCRIVTCQYGERTGLLAAFFLSVTPIFIAVSRTNNLDASLVFVCLLAIWALQKASEKGSLRYLCLSAALLGIGFNIKMLQAYLYLPAFFLVYLFSSAPGPDGRRRWLRRLSHLLVAAVVLAAVSLPWCLAVDLTPPADRPYVGSSTTNSMLELAIGYNGLLRALPIFSKVLGGIGGPINMVPNEGGTPGFLRLFNLDMYGQVSWLLPLGLFGLAGLFKNMTDPAGEKAEARRHALLWGGLFLPMAVFFSLTEHMHQYYLIMLAPCLAALAAIAVTSLTDWKARDEAAHTVRQLNLLPAAFAVTAAVQLVMLAVFYGTTVKPLLYILPAAEGMALVLYIFIRRGVNPQKTLRTTAVAVALAGLCAAPLYWSCTPFLYGVSAVMPSTGPRITAASIQHGDNSKTPKDNPWAANWFAGDFSAMLVPPQLTAYIVVHDNGSKYLISVPSAIYAAPIILGSDASVMTRGGFTGFDKAVTLDRFKEIAARGEIQFFYCSDLWTDNDIIKYARQYGQKVPPSAYGGHWGASLYDLTGLKAEQ
jgi:4-amino-4-deoxy-L-arabinose transferase-like glycosyltransferase